MSEIQLIKGSRKSLSSKPNTSLGKVDIGIRLKSKEMDIHTIVDIALVCKKNDKTIQTIWYGQPSNENGSIKDTTVQCQGSSWNDDDVRICIDFNKIPTDIKKMSIVTSILWGQNIKMHFGMMEEGYMAIYNDEEKVCVAEQHISDWHIHEGKTGLIWAEIYPYKNEWKVKAIEESIICMDLGELVTMASNYL